ncbi:MAG TPA: polyphosphate kinase 1 [Patescibacteria group bacterium]|nr:polyphosphate kinase 1 [Patescibacteria group bacterium]
MSKPRDLRDPTLYINRELSQIDFNFRVLAQAQDPSMPLLERVRFLCICSSNIDEFFEIRVAALKLGGSTVGPDGLSTLETLHRVRSRALELLEDQYRLWNRTLRPALAEQGIRVLLRDEWNAKQRRWLQGYFQNEILPVLSPLGLDPAHPFPRILNKSLNLVVLLKGKDAFGREGNMALVRAPRSLPRVIRLPAELSDGTQDFVLLSGVLQEFVDELFPGMQVKGSYQFRVTRNSELSLDEDEAENLAHAMKEELQERGFAHAVRLEVADALPRPTLKILMANFAVAEDDIYRCQGPVNLNRVMAIYDMIDRPDLKFPKFTPRIDPRINNVPTIFDAIRGGDILLHHPFDSFATVLEFVRQAATDPGVHAIKQTLYRAGKDSPLVAYLIEAARAGKDVTVVIELRARFDEEANLSLADRLQEAGVQVVYGVVGFKTHAKMMLVVRRESNGLRRYVHLSTGNYHASTARAYTDLGLLTCDAEIGEDVHKLFQQLSGLGPVIKLKRILQSPFTLHKSLLAKIEREIENVKRGRPAAIRAKINHLNEAGVIRLLYEASQAGVRIDLIVRGTCALRPGVPGVSENIRVRSLVGRFLEHSRVYWFQNDDQPEIYCSSADWLERNLLRRVETCFPILDVDLAKRVYDEEIENYLADNQQAWSLDADGHYTRVEPGDAMPHSAQNSLLARLCG